MERQRRSRATPGFLGGPAISCYYSNHSLTPVWGGGVPSGEPMSLLCSPRALEALQQLPQRGVHQPLTPTHSPFRRQQAILKSPVS